MFTNLIIIFMNISSIYILVLFILSFKFYGM